MPYAARVRCERGLLTRNQGELEAGMHVLEALGDLDQLARVERARDRSRLVVTPIRRSDGGRDTG